jgi:branched-chain amino acid aminotransferase
MAAPRIELCPSPNRLDAASREAMLVDPGFGRLYTEHMVTIRYREGQGWESGQLVPYAPIELSPAASVLHYGQAVFEGFKAFRQPDGGISTFRPEANALRMQASAARLAMPALTVEHFVTAADTLISFEHDWVPSGRGRSLYLRPLLIATEAALGVRPAKEYLFLLFGSPSGAYFKGGISPVTVWICKDYVRAAPGGTGAAKTAGNYAASLPAQAQAAKEGCDQVVWLDAVTRRNVEEMGGMNIFFVYEENGKITLVTPKLTGSLLPGITRDSLLKLGADLGFIVEERTVTIDEWLADASAGKMVEAFACGTAAVITPIGALKDEHGIYPIRNAATSPVASKLRERLMDMQYGTGSDPYGWMHRVC